MAIIAIPTINSQSSNKGAPLPIKDAATVLAVGVAVASVLSAGYYYLMLKFTSFLVKSTFYFAILSNFLLAALFFYQKQYVGGIIWVVLAFVFAFIYWSWRSRIPFAILMLENVLGVANQFPSLFLVALVQLVFTIGWVVLWSITFVGLTIKFSTTTSNNTNSTNVPQIILSLCIVLLLDAGHRAKMTDWELAKLNVLNPQQTLRAIAQNARNESARDGNIIGVFIAACLACLLQMLGDLVEYFNVYAFAEVAIYGKDYCSAAKDTWNLVKRKGVDAIINDSLIGNVLGMGTLLIGVLCAAVGGLYVAFSDSVKSNWYQWAGTSDPAGVIALSAIICLMIGLAIFGSISSIINSGVATTFVCLAEDPYALARTKPALFQEIQRVYPQINMYVS
ncbi:putative choline transporter, neither null mutation nor overexpression affects choline transport [Gonapodya sp. JEL0774]|nr:putative choline transporter, neither null mutation nor overexpression affects choline transport [Gonapodya sp. JEL0774]